MTENTQMIDRITPQECFDAIKAKKEKITDEELVRLYDNCLIMLNKYKITGQISAMKKLIFHLENIEKERELVKIGIDTFVYRTDIEEYIKNVSGKVVKVARIEDYEREIPDNIVDIIAKTKELFSELYIVFTDYTGEQERKIEKRRREYDPILFGSFEDVKNRLIIERFYFLGDWVDEYCDLTLGKLISETQNRTGNNISMSISTPKDLAELKQQLNNIEIDRSTGHYKLIKKAKGFRGLIDRFRGNSNG